MGFFGKKTPPTPPLLATPPADAADPARPMVVTDNDIQRAATLMDQFSRAPGNDGALRAFGAALNQAGGFVSPRDILDAVFVAGPEATNRPWLWLAAVTRAALGQGDHLLVAQIALASWFWSTQIAPLLGSADSLDGIVDSPSGDALDEIFAAGREAISRLPIDMVIMETPIATLLSRDVLDRIS
jgi:hypothetical protein